MGNTASNGTQHPSHRTDNASLYGRQTNGESGRKLARRNLNSRQSWPNLSSVDYHNSANLRSNVTGMRPITFNQVHGQNIVRSQDGLTVTREGSFCNALVFSSRAIRPQEPFSIRLQQCTRRGWSGVLRFGYTLHCPDRQRSSTLPKYVCPDMTVKPGNWAKALKESTVHHQDVLTLFFNIKGEVFLSVNRGRFNQFFNGVDATKPLWALIDVYGNTTGLKVEVDYDIAIPNERQLRTASVALTEGGLDVLSPTGPSNPPRPVAEGAEGHPIASIPPVVPSSLPSGYERSPFHGRAHGHNIIFRENGIIAERRQDSFSGGLVFTSSPILIGEQFSINIVGLSNRYIGNLGVGLTACNPDDLSEEVLPSESEQLVDRPEYWVITKELNLPEEGGEIGFVINAAGEFHQVAENGSTKGILMHVDISVQLWLLLDVYGATRAIRSKGKKRLPANVFQNATVPRPTIQTAPSACAQVHQPLVATPQAEPTNPPIPKAPPVKTVAEVSTRGSSKTRPKPPRPSQPPRKRDDECKICMERSVNTVFYKCGHQCACEDCGFKLKNKQCPLCRAVIHDVIKVYRS